jgi:hypothetical protein
VSIQQYLLPEIDFMGQLRPHFNNYLIFKFSFHHLLDNQNLYTFYPEEYGDLFKYSPTFALFMGSFYFLPNWLGIVVWNLLNVLIFLWGIKLVPNTENKTKAIIILFVLFELIGNIQNEQSNTLMAGLMVLSFGFFERKNLLLAALVIALSIYIKLFGAVAIALFILYPNKFRFVAFLSFWLLALWTLPLLVINPEELINQYFNWFELLKSDHGNLFGYSVYGMLHTWLAIEPSKWMIMLMGVIMFATAFFKRSQFKDTGFHLLTLSSVLIWVNLFNHNAESSGYILSMTGIGFWYFTQEKNRINTFLVILAFVFVSLIYSDITPGLLRHGYIYPYYIKTIPVIIIWLRILYEMIFTKYSLKKIA